MAGTYILTDTINNSFAAIFQTASKGHDVVVSPTETLGREVRSQTSPVTAADARTGARARRASPKPPARSSPTARSSTRAANGSPAASRRRSSPRRCRRASSPSSRSKAASRRPRARSRSTRRPPNARACSIGRQMIVAGSAATGRYTIVGILTFGGGESFGGAGAALLLPAEAQRLLGQPGRFDQIDVAAQPGVAPGQLRDRIRAELPGTVDVRTGAEQADHRHQQPGTQPRRPAHVPADLRLRRAGRRRLHHLQHLLDHRRPAHARVRAAAHARRLAPPDPALGRLRRAAARRARRGARPARAGSRSRRRSTPLFKAFGADLPDNGTVIETRTIVVSLLVGHRRDGARRACRRRCARPACRRWPRCARGSQIPPRPLPSTQAADHPLRARLVAGRRAQRDRVGQGLGIASLIVVWCCAARACSCGCAAAKSARAPLPDRPGARPRDRPARALARDHRPAGARRTRSASRGARSSPPPR